MAEDVLENPELWNAYWDSERSAETRNGISGIKLHYYQFAGLPDRFSLFPGLRGLTPDQLLTKNS